LVTGMLANWMMAMEKSRFALQHAFA